MHFSSRFLLVLFLLGSHFPATAQPRVTRVDPPNWWVGMKLDTLRLMMYGDSLGGCRAVSETGGVSVLRSVPAASSHYLFVDVRIEKASQPGVARLRVVRGSEATEIHFPILARERARGRYRGFSPSDVIYLITPDRFANGDTSNDAVAGLPEGVDRSKPYARHGGDIQGIMHALPYFTELGVTTLWVNPLIENAGMVSYHGYAATDLYRIDPRFGDTALYARLVSEAHNRGLKVIMDHVLNHIGIMHPWMKDLPTPTWCNGTVRSHEITRHVKEALTDPHAANGSIDNVVRGWFSNGMPDLNQQDPSLAAYLVQNTIWWIEMSGIDGIREDTYPYVDEKFAASWCDAILREYPDFTIVGEVWMEDPAFVAPFQRKSSLVPGLDPALPSVTDFGLFGAFQRVFNGHESIFRVYECLAKDYLYAAPANMLTFVDNHDLHRILQQTGGDSARARLAVALLLTTRGIPQLYYATEIGMRGGDDHGTIRSDFPGGFPGDRRNAFTREGRTPEENRMFDFVKRLINVRKAHPAISSGALVQFPPREEVYCYRREAPGDTVLVAINNSPEPRTVTLADFQMSHAGELKNLIDEGSANTQPGGVLTVPGNSAALWSVGAKR